ncbi:regulatory protein, luxR family [Alkalispirochaeta americana]|uniref:Regulatory protein, luxR family n=1 Tax=Alkalispirochaeta americana TaxID=159291 RepID=A0A1N6QEE2_9SPIO|nr:helix-turn-helix transcriptional regulator [Alkalispirochaeta americana]SIQ14882.1 regulatory protein, luxR family [Alkalispirochaeta americana]
MDLPGELQEREKELSCIYRVTKDLSPQKALEKTLSDVARALHQALAHPETMTVGILLDTSEYWYPGPGPTGKTPPVSQEPENHQTTPIVSRNGTLGEIHIIGGSAHSLLPQEARLAEAVAALLANNAEQRQAEAELTEAMAAENRKTVALTEVLAQIEEQQHHYQTDLQQDLNSRIFPILSRLESFLTGPAEKALGAALRNALLQFGAPRTSRHRELSLRLSPREQEIADLIASGLSTKQIAHALGITGSTIERHRHNIRKKAGISCESVHLASFLRNTASTFAHGTSKSDISWK